MSLKYVAAVLLCHFAGSTVSVDAIEKVIGSIGGTVDSTVIKQLMSAIEGKSVEEVLNAGMSKLSSVPSGGAAAAAPGAGKAAAPEAEKPAVEEKKEEPEEEEDDDMGFGLFD